MAANEEMDKVEAIKDIHSDIEHVEEDVVVTPTTGIKVTQQFAFYGEDGVLYQWNHGQVVTDPEVIEELIERGVKHEVIEA